MAYGAETWTLITARLFHQFKVIQRAMKGYAWSLSEGPYQKWRDPTDNERNQQSLPDKQAEAAVGCLICRKTDDR